MANTILGMVRPRELDRSEVRAALTYALKPELVALYAVVYVGVVISDWNLLRLFLGVLYRAPEPMVYALLDLFGFLTSIVGYGLAAAGVVGVLKTVIEDSLRQSGADMAHANDGA